MKKEQLIKELQEDNKSDLENLDLSKEEYQKLKNDWLNRETDEFEVVGQVELRKLVIERLGDLREF